MPSWTGTAWRQTSTGITFFRPPSGFGTVFDTWIVRYRNAAGAGWITRTLRARESFEFPRSLTSGLYEWQARFYNSITGVTSPWTPPDTASQRQIGRVFILFPFPFYPLMLPHGNMTFISYFLSFSCWNWRNSMNFMVERCSLRSIGWRKTFSF